MPSFIFALMNAIVFAFSKFSVVELYKNVNNK